MIVKAIYKALRSIIFSVTLVIVGIYVLTYTLISIPGITNKIKELACSELSGLLGAQVIIDQLDIYPFNEAKISGIHVYDPAGIQCIEIETVGAGINLWKLLSEQKIVLTFGEIIGLNAFIQQPEDGAPLNIDFIIRALSGKNDQKEKKHFELALRNVVIRKSAISFSRPWLNHKSMGSLDLSFLRLNNLAADISFPKISDSGVDIDLRRLSLNMVDAFEIEKLAFKGEFNPDLLYITDFILEFPNSRLFIPEINISSNENGNLIEAVKNNPQIIEISDSYLTPSDFSFIFPPLNQFDTPLPLYLKAKGNFNILEISEFNFGVSDVMALNFTGKVEGFNNIEMLKGDLKGFNLSVNKSVIHFLTSEIKKISSPVRHALSEIGDFNMTGNFEASMKNLYFKGNSQIITDAFALIFDGEMQRKSGDNYNGKGEFTLENLKLQKLFPSVPLSNINANIVADASLEKLNPQGILNLVIEDFEYKGKKYDGLSLNINKEGEFFDGDILMHNQIADIEAKFSGDIEGEDKEARVDLDLQNLNLSEITDLKSYNDYIIRASLNIDGSTHGSSEILGQLVINNFSFAAPDNSKSLKLKELTINAEKLDSINTIDLKSDWLDFRTEGNFNFKTLPAQLTYLAQTICPAFIGLKHENKYDYTTDIDFDLVVHKNNSVPDFFKLPFRLLVPVTIAGSISGSENNANLTLDLPYLQQGKDKLIYDTKLVADIDGNKGTLNVIVQTTMPVKRGDLALDVNLFGQNNSLSTDIRWVNTENEDFKGHLQLITDFSRNELSKYPEINLQINPSVLHMGTADWFIGQTHISYYDKYLEVDKLKLWHEDQFVEVNGIASPEYQDAVTIKLADIDVDYVFDMLQINYVTFGGTATGEITGRALLSGDPIAETESLVIKNFSYNDVQMGECVASSRWNNEAKEIELGADITHNGKRRVLAAGGIWLGRDSLSFDIHADKVPVDFVQPFMAVFSSHVGGFATGDVKLFGTFHDIDMTGRIFADSVAVKLDYTNTVYHGSDSVILTPGHIDIPHFRLYDKFGNSALLTGELSHYYFHDPSFNFRLSEANNFLCYDTNSDINPDWYGTLFGSGSALLQGLPGLVDISADMTVSGNSNFTFVLNETEYARDYQFLTFSDRRAEELKKNQELTTQDIKAMLKKSMQEEAGLSRFGIDIRASVTPQALFTLVMDPAAGDKITARGRGAMQVKYESDNDEMTMYGKYEIDEGNYNFSLQDIILRDFKIKEGSYISFNGNPLAADLDISATYRVNTNLSDLDKSFSTDRDLNRTNVPVDAVLSVTGNMTSPDITFDIELPTLTQDVERKVKSIISTDDMMNRQIIYLLALNRFYTPEYMGATGNGGELAAVASSTISSQLSNILGQLTDKFSVSPSFRSDKGDFSDIEVDVALSSKLMNNRLLINGNFGYRDRSNSSTTFVGDFDVEYLLSKNGNLRLKAYNHFNDQNYYLREALTTQGLGIVYRRDFDDWFTFLKRKKKKNEDSDQLIEIENSTDGTQN